MVDLLLVRHGESEWNAVGRWQGWADPPLTDLGRRQATMAARRLGHIDGVASSDLHRARATAALLSEGRAGAVRAFPELRERDVGEWTGLTRPEIEARWPGGLSSLATEGAPGGETTEQVLDRVQRALQGLAADQDGEGGGRVLVVTHGGVMRTLERMLSGSTHPVANLGGLTIHVQAGRFVLGPRVELITAVDVPVTTPGAL